MKILLVEDDLNSADLLTATFSAYRHTVDTATDGQTGLQLALEWDYDVILLDVMMPKMDGISLCRELRSQRCQTPILMLTAKGAAEDIISGLDAGADDYVTKPYDLDQLLARVRALTRRANKTPDVALRWGKLSLDPALIRVTYDQREVSLTPKEYSLLELLLRHPQRIFTRSAVIDHLWAVGEAPSQGTVTNLIKDLRQRLKSAGIVEEVIQTIYGVGYRLSTEPATEDWQLQDTEAQLLNDAKDQEFTCKKVDTEGRIHERSDKYIRGHIDIYNYSNIREHSHSREHMDLTLVAQVTQQFQSSISERIRELELAVLALQSSCPQPDQQYQIQLEAHRLAGNLGCFGYTRGSDVARSIEHLLMDAPIMNPPITQLKGLVQELKQCLQSPPVLEVSPASSNRLLLIIGRETSFTQLLKQKAEQWGMDIEVVGDRPTMLHRIATVAPSAILVNLNGDPQSQPLALLQELKTEFPGVSVFGLTDAAVASSLMFLTELGIYQCFSSTTPPQQVLQAIASSISAAQVHHPTVLMLDDDPLILQKMSSLLLSQRIQVMCLMQPQQFWNMFNAVSPDVLLLDLEMPLCHGLDICKTLRLKPKFRNLPIIVVTAHTDAISVKAAFDAGATDVIGKPLVPDVLVAGVRTQIARFRQPALIDNQPNICAAVNSSWPPSNTGMRSPR